MPAQRKYPGELRERAVKMVFEVRDRDGKGCQARGVDEDGYADWINRVTGTPDDFPHADRDLDFHAWSGAHEWMLSAERIGVLSHEAARSGTPMFLCGTASGDGGVWHLFGKVLALVIDVPTLKQGVAARTDKFGKAPEELAAILGWHAGYEVIYRGFGAVIIDAARPLNQVVDEILAESAGSSGQGTANVPEGSSPLR